jgi:hypothetical protein
LPTDDGDHGLNADKRSANEELLPFLDESVVTHANDGYQYISIDGSVGHAYGGNKYGGYEYNPEDEHIDDDIFDAEESLVAFALSSLFTRFSSL